MKGATRNMLLCGAAVVAVQGSAAAAQEPGTIEFDEDAIIVLGNRLEESVPEELAEYGSRLEVIEGETIDQAGFVDAAQALQSFVPGLYLAPKSGAFDYVDVSLLGSRTSDVLFLVDGVRISNRLYASTTPLDTLPANMIERIEVLKGGQSLYYGTQAVGGVINIVTKSFTSQTDGAFEVGVDTNEGYHLNGFARGGFGDHYFVGYASHDQAEGFSPFREEDYQPSQTDRTRGYNVTTLGAKYAFQPSDAFRLSASYQHTEADLDFAVAEDRYLNRNDRNEEVVSLKIDWSPSENLDIFVKGYWHDWDTEYVRLDNVLGDDGQPTGELVSIYDGEIWAFEDRGINILGEYRASENVALVAGYDFQKYDGKDDVFLIAPQTESVHAPFAQVKFDLDALSLAAGLRHNMPSDGEEKTVWNVTGRYDLDGGLYARGLVGTSFRLPTAYELYVIDPCCEQGNPNLVGEESFNVEGGVGFDGQRFNVELIGFYREVEDLIGITYDLPGYDCEEDSDYCGFLINTDGQVEVWGGEIIANARLNDVLSLTVDYTHSESEQADSSEQITGIPRDQAKFIVNAQAPSGRFGGIASLNWVGDIYNNPGGLGRANSGNYAVLDLSAYAFVDAEQRHRIGLRLENALDADYDTRLTRVREDITDDPYMAGFRGTPITLHATYKLSL